MAETTENVTQNGSIASAIHSIMRPETVEKEENDTKIISDENDEVEESEDDVEEVTDEESDSDTEDEDSEDAEEDTEEATSKSEPVYTIKIDGTEKQVTLNELKRGYGGQQYVQKGMQEAAQQRKQAESVYAALLNERQQVASLYQQMQSGQIATAPQVPSRALFESDPLGYMEAKLDYDDKIVAFNQQNQQVLQLIQQQTQAEKSARQAYIQRELESLKGAIPELANPAKAGEFKDKIVRAGEVYGYTPEEIGQAIDHRALHVLRDAMKYREIMGGKKKADEKSATARPKTTPIKAGSKRIDDSQRKQTMQSKTKLKSTGDIKDAISLMFN